MTNYRLEVKFTGCKRETLIWWTESDSTDLLIQDIVEKLRSWIGARSLYLKRMNQYEYSIRLMSFNLGIVSIKIVHGDDGES